ncbi:hypothetical protein [Comamonas sp. SCN 65-56]|uniref:hypothetical protein n=1 Tax=Comamonas sp. SCN 65-56 TaxID=1660095 RepID=UPI0025C2A57A|nr:hypothetical protein [Comamonas sp. SCN 65-56]
MFDTSSFDDSTDFHRLAPPWPRSHFGLSAAPAPTTEKSDQVLAQRARLVRLVTHRAQRLGWLGATTAALDTYRPPTAKDVPVSGVIIATWWEAAEWLMQLPDTSGVKAYLTQGCEIVINDSERPDLLRFLRNF